MSDTRRNTLHPFTEEQRAELLKNPYTRKVTTYSVSFTEQFAKDYMQLFNQGMSDLQAIQALGYSLEILGVGRAHSIGLHIRERIKREGNAGERIRLPKRGRPPNDARNVIASIESEPPEVQLKALKNEVVYLRQEIDFIKKILQSGTT